MILNRTWAGAYQQLLQYQFLLLVQGTSNIFPIYCSFHALVIYHLLESKIIFFNVQSESRSAAICGHCCFDTRKRSSSLCKIFMMLLLIGKYCCPLLYDDLFLDSCYDISIVLGFWLLIQYIVSLQIWFLDRLLLEIVTFFLLIVAAAYDLLLNLVLHNFSLGNNVCVSIHYHLVGVMITCQARILWKKNLLPMI